MRSLKIIVNRLSIFLLISLFLFTPFHVLQKLIFIYPLFATWLVSAYRIDNKFLSRSLTYWIFFACFALLWFFYSIFHQEWEFLHFINHIFLTYMWILMFIFYKSHLDIFSILIYPIFVLIVVSCLFTVLGNIILPGASRYLGSSASEYSFERELAISMNVGGFGFIYSLTFIVIAIVGMIKSNSVKWFMLVVLSVISVTVVVSSYFMAILFVAMFLVLSNSSANNFSRTIILLALLGISVLLLKDLILESLMDFGKTIDSPMLYYRAEQMLTGTYQSHYDEMGNLSRYDLMRNGLMNFLESPIIGQMRESSPNLISGHSEIIGYFEKYGIFGLIYIYFFIKVYFVTKKTFVTNQFRIMYFFLFIGIILIAFFNTFSVSCEAGLTGFFLAPIILGISQKSLSYKMH